MSKKYKEFLVEQSLNSRSFEINDDKITIEYQGKPPVNPIRTIEASAYLDAIEKINKLWLALEDACDTICGEFCGTAHHPLCIKPKAVLKETKE